MTRVWFVTFPQKDIVRRDCYAVVEAETETEARQQIVDVYGRDGWAFLYDTPEQAGVERYRLSKIEFGQ